MSRPLHHFARIARGARGEVSDISLHAAQDVDIFGRGEVAGLALRDELGSLLGAGCAAFARCLQRADFLEQAEVDVEEEGGALVFDGPAAGAARGGRGGRF